MKGERQAVHAVSFAGRARPIREYVAQVAAATRAVHLDAGHPVAAIGRGAHRVAQGRPETRPAGAALEFRRCVEERPAAPGAVERALALFMVQRARSARLGAVLAKHLVLLGRERGAPLLFGLGHEAPRGPAWSASW